MADDLEFLTPNKVAEIFGVTGETIRDWIADEKLTGTKINGRWYVSRASVTALARERHG